MDDLQNLFGKVFGDREELQAESRQGVPGYKQRANRVLPFPNTDTLLGIIMEVENGPLDDHFPLQIRWCHPLPRFQGVYSTRHQDATSSRNEPVL